MKQYLLSIYQPDGDPPPPAVLGNVMRDLDALHAELKATGAWVFVAGLLAPRTAMVVRFQDGNVLTTDGPYAEGKEHIGGFIVIRAPDLDTALEWGRKLSRATDPADRGAAVAGRCGRHEVGGSHGQRAPSRHPCESMGATPAQ